jgi:transposase
MASRFCLAVGIDLGLKTLAVLSTGETVERHEAERYRRSWSKVLAL